MLTIEAAGLKIRIENRYGKVAWLCRDYLTADSDVPDISVRITEEELRRKMKAFPGVFQRESEAETVLVYEKISARLSAFDAFVLHASAVAVDGNAYAFTAESGTGKSTHTGYWRELLGDRMTVINGDKPICRFAPDGDLWVYGTPWNGKEDWGQPASAPLRGLCLLERSRENAVIPLSPAEAWRALLPALHLTQPPENDLAGQLRLFRRMLSAVPLYRLRCRKDPSAGETAIRALLPGLLPEA